MQARPAFLREGGHRCAAAPVSAADKGPVEQKEGAGRTNGHHQQHVFDNLARPVGRVGQPEMAQTRMQVKGHPFHLQIVVVDRVVVEFRIRGGGGGDGRLERMMMIRSTAVVALWRERSRGRRHHHGIRRSPSCLRNHSWRRTRPCGIRIFVGNTEGRSDSKPPKRAKRELNQSSRWRARGSFRVDAKEMPVNCNPINRRKGIRNPKNESWSVPTVESSAESCWLCSRRMVGGIFDGIVVR